MKYNNLIISLLFFVNQWNSVHSKLRYWLGSQNSKTEIDRYNCKGLYFPEELFPVIFLTTRIVNSLHLPITGMVAIDNFDKIIFDSNEKSCKEITITNDFANRPNNWNPLPNRAIPFFDRLPCQSDDIIIPSSDTLGIKFWPKIEANSIKIFDNKITTEDIESMVNLNLPLNLGLSYGNCSELEHCECHNIDDCGTMAMNYKNFVSWPEVQDEIYCEHPIVTFRNCHRICGSIILYEWSQMDVISQFVDFLKTENVDYHLGVKVSSKLNQLVIVDKEMETGGKYTREAIQKLKTMPESHNMIYKGGEEGQVLLAEEDYHNGNIIVISSGEPIIFGSFFSSGFGLLLITFFLNILIFGAIYIIFMTPNFRTFRINRTTFRTVMFAARYDNIGEGSDDEDNRSRVDISFGRTNALSSSSSSTVSTSTSSNIVQLEVPDEGALERHEHERAFDNPLYGKAIEEMHLHETDVAVKNEEELQQQQQEPQAKETGERSSAKSTKKGKKVKNTKKMQAKKGQRQQLIQEEDEDDELAGLQNLGECSTGYNMFEQCLNNPEIEDVKIEKEEMHVVHDSGVKEIVQSQEMLKFIEDNLQQVNLLDDEL